MRASSASLRWWGVFLETVRAFLTEHVHALNLSASVSRVHDRAWSCLHLVCERLSRDDRVQVCRFTVHDDGGAHHVG